MNQTQYVFFIFWFLLIVSMPCATLLPSELGTGELIAGSAVMLMLLVFTIIGTYQLVGRLNA